MARCLVDLISTPSCPIPTFVLLVCIDHGLVRMGKFQNFPFLIILLVGKHQSFLLIDVIREPCNSERGVFRQHRHEGRMMCQCRSGPTMHALRPHPLVLPGISVDFQVISTPRLPTLLVEAQLPYPTAKNTRTPNSVFTAISRKLNAAENEQALLTHDLDELQPRGAL